MKKIGLLMLVMMISLATFAQPDGDGQKRKGERKEKIKAAKVAFITQKISLTSSEAEKFWPIYNQWQADKKEITGAKGKRNKKKQDLSDQEAEALILKKIDGQVDVAKLNRDYYFKLKTVISPNRILQMQKAEKQFQRKLLKRIKGGKKNKGKMKNKKGDRRRGKERGGNPDRN